MGWPQVCTPQSATLCVAGDDDSYFWINGTAIVTNQPSGGGTLFPYVNWDQPDTPLCVSVPIGILTANNTIAAVTYNRHCCEVWTSWALDISCFNTTNHTVVTNASGGVSLYYDSAGTTPPPPNGGYNWYQPLYVAPNPYFTSPIFTDTGTIWGKQIYDPVTGLKLPPSSYSTGGGANGNETLYWRQGFNLNTVVVLPPPNFTITKSANPTSNINSSQRVTYSLTVCNSGQAMAGPVTVVDVYTPDMRYDGALNAPFTGGPPDAQVNQSANATTFIYLKGFPGGGACQTIQYKMTDDYVDPSEYCAVRPNTATVHWNASTASANAAITLYCPPLTPTFTPTPTYTPTPTFTFTPTWTNTLPPGTYTPTSVFTSTPTYTSTPTWTVTITPVPGSCSLPPSRTASKWAYLTFPVQMPFRQTGLGSSFRMGSIFGIDLVSGLFIDDGLTISGIANDSSHSENDIPWPDGCRQEKPLFAMINRGNAHARSS